MTTTEKNNVMHQERLGDVDVVQTLHADGTIDFVDTHAIGGDAAQMPEGYYWSPQFIGTVIVSSSFHLSSPIFD
jgi:hypothetical protein